MARKVEMTLEFQNYITHVPMHPDQLYSTAASNDKVTIEAWEKTWSKNIKDNHKKFGSFKEHGIGQLFDIWANRSAIIAGAGPSLKNNGHLLKDRGGVPLISCLHNFHFFEDRGIDVDFYCTLDAGPVVVEEVYEGGEHEPEWYWERTKGKKLLAYVGTDPKLFEKWQGEVFFYNCPLPSQAVNDALKECEEFHSYVSNGGNVLGACLYIAKGIFGANPIAFVGADFCFSYDKKFHGWDSKYDAKMGETVRTTDVYGNSVHTWRSYMSFKCWFDYLTIKVPGVWINCTEGGTFGAYPDGNLMQIKQMELAEFLDMQSLNLRVKDQFLKPEINQNLILF